MITDTIAKLAKYYIFFNWMNYINDAHAECHES